MSGSSDSNLAGIGALLTTLTSVFSLLTYFMLFSPLSGVALSLSAVSLVVGPMSLAGLILFLVGMYKLAHGYGRPIIFNGPLYSLLTAIVGFVVVFALGFSILFLNIRNIVSSLRLDIHTPFVPQTVLPEILRALAWYLVPIFFAAFTVVVVSAVFQMRGFNALAQESGVPWFRTTGLLFPVSAAISIFSVLAAVMILSGQFSFVWLFVFFLPGMLVQLAAWVLATRAFFLLKAKMRVQVPTYSTPVTSPRTFTSQPKGKFCSNCGYQNIIGSVYCSNCGKPFDQPTAANQV